jgi:hypothetical protein
LSLAILATVATDVTHRALATSSYASALTSGYQRAFQISAVVTVIALFVSFALPRNTGRAVVATSAQGPEFSQQLPVEPA